MAGVCDSDPRGSQVTTEYFAAGTEPTESCDKHVLVTICAASGKPAGPYCPKNQLSSRAYISGGSSGTEDAPYLLPANLSTGKCPIHETPDIDPVDITGDTGREDEPEEPDVPTIPGDGETDEPNDSHTGLDDADQVLIEPEDVSE